MILRNIKIQSIGQNIGKPPIYNIFRSTSSSSQKAQSHQAVFIENNAEVPVLIVAENDIVDLIGPPDPVSNLRPVIRKRLLNETVLQQQLRELQDATHFWNQEFWTSHNIRFKRERQEYVDSHQLPGEEKRQLTADEMSEFYKDFLDKNWKTHVNYNKEWYKKNFQLLILAFKVNVERYLLKLRHPVS